MKNFVVIDVVMASLCLVTAGLQLLPWLTGGSLFWPVSALVFGCAAAVYAWGAWLQSR